MVFLLTLYLRAVIILLVYYILYVSIIDPAIPHDKHFIIIYFPFCAPLFSSMLKSVLLFQLPVLLFPCSILFINNEEKDILELTLTCRLKILYFAA